MHGGSFECRNIEGCAYHSRLEISMARLRDGLELYLYILTNLHFENPARVALHSS